MTDKNGRTSLRIPPGHHSMTVRAEGASVQELPALACRPGLDLDVLVTLDERGTLVAFDVPFLDPADRDMPTLPLPEAPAMAPAPSATEHEELATASEAPAAARRVRLVVRDALNGAPLPDVRCDVRGRGFVGMTNDDGALVFEAPTEASAVSLIRVRYAPRVLPLLAARTIEAEDTIMEAELLPAAETLDELVVRAPHIEGTLAAAVEERRESKSVAEVMGADQIRRAGDSDAAAALRRTTGLTVVGGRYVYVRGLGERYSTTLFDGMSLPSPEPERRVVPLDMFPSGVLSGLVVHKSWSPELPGEFGGGAVLLRTRRVPERAFLDVSLSSGGMWGSTFTDAPMSAGGSLDLIGLDDGRRALPPALAEASRTQLIAERNALSGTGYTPKELERFGESLSREYTPRVGMVMPNMSATTSFGAPVDVGFGSVGVLGSLMWSKDEQHTDIERRTVALGGDGVPQARDEGVVSATDKSVTLGGLLSVGLELDGPLSGHALQSTTFLNRVADDEVRVLEGFEDDANTQLRATRLRWVERTLFSQRVGGDHPLPLLSSTLQWHYGYALALRDEPDLRELRYDQDLSSGQYLLVDRPEGNQRMFSALDDHVHDAQLTWTVPLPAWQELLGAGAADVRVGARITTKTRAVDTRRYKFVIRGPAASAPELRALDAESIFTPEHIGQSGFQLIESTRNTDNYGGGAQLGALFAVADVPLPGRITLTGGARLEVAHIAVSTFELFNAAATPTESALDTVDVLPSLGATWAFRDDMQLRATGAVTASRPELRELSPAVFTDVTGGRSRYGNPDLKPASIAHADLRWEWYPSATESLSVAAFGKQFTAPIETVITAGADQAVTWANAERALNLGVEAEARLELARALPVLEGLYVAGNGALIFSSVTLPEDGIQTSKERPLEGQSPWVANVQLGWERESLGTRATLLYNVAGPRVREVGVLGAPDVYEQPVHQVDLVMGQNLVGGLRLTVKAQNILAAPMVITQGGIVMERVERAPVVSASLGMRL